MDAVGSVCFFAIVVGTCIINGCLVSTIVIIKIIIIIIINIISGADEKDIKRGLQKF
jgi:hypothetical protein